MDWWELIQYLISNQGRLQYFVFDIVVVDDFVKREQKMAQPLCVRTDSEYTIEKYIVVDDLVKREEKMAQLLCVRTDSEYTIDRYYIYIYIYIIYIYKKYIYRYIYVMFCVWCPSVVCGSSLRHTLHMADSVADQMMLFNHVSNCTFTRMSVIKQTCGISQLLYILRH